VPDAAPPIDAGDLLCCSVYYSRRVSKATYHPILGPFFGVKVTSECTRALAKVRTMIQGVSDHHSRREWISAQDKPSS